MQELLGAIQFLRKRLYFPDGCVVLLAISIGAYHVLSKSLGTHIIEILRWIGIPNVDNVAHIIYLIGFAGTVLGVVFFWRKQRRTPRFEKGHLGVIFAPNFPEDLNEDVELILIQLSFELNSHQLLNRFSIKKLPPNLSISSPDEASSLLRQSKGTVAVWGLIDEQKTGDTRIAGFSSISFTFVHSPSHVPPQRHQALALSLAGKQFHTNERTQLADRNIMARDIGLIVRNMIGAALLIDQNWPEAVKVFFSLHTHLSTIVTPKSSVPFRRFRAQVGYDLAFALTMSDIQQYNKYLFGKRLFDIPKKECRSWLTNADQAILLDPQNSAHYLSKGIYHFLLGELDHAIGAEKKAGKRAPSALATPNFSLAFLYNFTGQFEASKKEYRLGMAKKQSYDEDMINQCISFIEQSVAHFPEIKQLRLALGLVEIHRGSVEAGIAALTTFLDAPPSDPELERFVHEGSRLLKEAEVIKHDQSTTTTEN